MFVIILLSLYVIYKICMHFLDFVCILLRLHALYKVCVKIYKVFVHFYKVCRHFIKFAGVLSIPATVPFAPELIVCWQPGLLRTV